MEKLFVSPSVLYSEMKEYRSYLCLNYSMMLIIIS